MSLHHITIHHPGVAGCQLRGDAMLLLDGIELLGFDDLDLEAVIFHVLDPGLAAAAVLGFVDGHLLRCQGRETDGTGQQGQ
ncbi:hypothetical protein D3C86_1255450 [compost metagenome]